jgi:hypothetical protein
VGNTLVEASCTSVPGDVPNLSYFLEHMHVLKYIIAAAVNKIIKKIGSDNFIFIYYF